MGKKSKLKAARRREQPVFLESRLDGDDGAELLDAVVAHALTSFREGDRIHGRAILRSLSVILAAWELRLDVEELLARAEQLDVDFLGDCSRAAVGSMALQVKEAGPHQAIARWGLAELGLTPADLGIRLLPPASDEEAEERAAQMVQVIEEVGGRAWAESVEPVRDALSAPG
jgi:hypothetical protein